MFRLLVYSSESFASFLVPGTGEAASRAHDLNQTNALGRFCGASRQHSRRAAISKKNPGPPGCLIRDQGAWLRGLGRPGKVEGFPLPALAEHKS
jgi:hypothetical protein